MASPGEITRRRSSLVEATSPDGLEFAAMPSATRAHFEEVLTWQGAGNKNAQSDDIMIVVIDLRR
jgi:hypothetical protein